ncbi:hypothetical protein RA264_27480, partial [Pseudomonas syringae pv. tagetis]
KRSAGDAFAAGLIRLGQPANGRIRGRLALSCAGCVGWFFCVFVCVVFFCGGGCCCVCVGFVWFCVVVGVWWWGGCCCWVWVWFLLFGL